MVSGMLSPAGELTTDVPAIGSLRTGLETTDGRLRSNLRPDT
jgi:hypothetical protein